MRRRNPLLLTLATGFGLSLPAPSLGGGFYLGCGNGSESLGMGGAFVAAGIDASAVWHNPANLTDLSNGFHFSTDLTGIMAEHTFFRDPNSHIEFTPPNGDEFPFGLDPSTPGNYEYRLAENIHGPLFIPSFSAVQVMDDWAFGAAFWTPYQGRMRYDAQGSTRYNCVYNNTIMYYVGGTVAWAPTSWLRLGGGVQAVHFLLGQDVHGFTPPFSLIGADTRLRLTSSGLTSKFNAGLTLLPNDRWRIGMSYRSHFSVEDDATIYVDLPDEMNSLGYRSRGNAGRFLMKFPGGLDAGVAFKANESVWLEADLAFEPWSRVDSLVIEADSIMIDVPDDMGEDIVAFDRFGNPFLMHDIFSFHVGGRYEPEGSRYQWRAGAFYEQSASPTKTYSVAYPDSDRLGISGGLSFQLGPQWWLNVSALHIIQKEVLVEDSVLRPPLTGPSWVQMSQSANGLYKSSYSMISMGLRLGT